VVALGTVELQCVRDALEHAVGDAPDVAAFEPGVVLDTYPREQGDLLAAQTGDPAVRAVHGQPGLVGRELGATAGEEVPDVLFGIHASTVRAGRAPWEAPRYPSSPHAPGVWTSWAKLPLHGRGRGGTRG
jgi:hypothetical protein